MYGSGKCTASDVVSSRYSKICGTLTRRQDIESCIGSDDLCVNLDPYPIPERLRWPSTEWGQRLSKNKARCSAECLVASLLITSKQSASYSSAFAFGSPIIDPLVTVMHFISVILAFHVFANESIIKATERAARNILSHTSVYLASKEIYHFQDAALRFRPNGRDILCHGQPARYIKKTSIANEPVIVFRCSHPDHPAEGPRGRKFIVKTLGSSDSVRFVEGCPRIMVTTLSDNEHMV
jgi:hypothetical protein